MLFTTSYQPRAQRSFLLAFIAIIVFLALPGDVSALPTSNRRAAALFEPLFQPASPSVGPQRSIERLRLRRALNKAQEQKSLPNPKSKRTAASVLLNPKKRATSAIYNPKSKRSITDASEKRTAPSLSNREVAAAALAAANADKEVTNSSVSRRTFIDLVRRIYEAKISGKPLDKRDLPRIILNPKRSITCQSSSVATTTTVALTTTTTTRAPTTTTTTTTAVRTTTTTARPTASAGAKSCSVTSDCAGQPLPANGHAYCNQTTKSCSFRCNTGYNQSGASCLAVSTPTRSPQSTTTTKAAVTTRTTTVAPTPSSINWPTSGGPIAGGYWADWNYEVLPVNEIDYDLYDIINYSFAVPTSDYDVKFIGWNSDSLLKSLVATAHSKNTKVAIAIGGWADSKYFSWAVANEANRNKFVANIARMVNQYGVDGVDIDWEYPGTNGAAGNYQSPSDTANFLLFLQALRRALGASAHITSCSTQRAFIGSNGSPLTDVSAFAAVLDGVLVMNYDVWGASSTPGPNAPLKNACPNSYQPNANMLSAIDAWSNAGMPRSKILMGVPAYGYVSASTATRLVNKRSVNDMTSTPSLGSLLARTDVNAPRPIVGLSNRERATQEHEAAIKEDYVMSPFHKAFVEGHARLAERQRARRAAKRAKRQQQAPIFCPNDHSGKPCEGIVGQNLTDVNWSPLADIKNGTGNSTDGEGVFNGNIGKTRLGKGDLTGLAGNQIQYWQLYNYGIIVNDGSNIVGTNGYTRAWDECSSTPYLYDVSRKTVVTYDDPLSMAKKGALAKSEKIGGILMWDMSGDTQDFELTRSWKRNML